MKFFATNVIHQLDHYTIEHEPISSIDLMERAADAIFQAFRNRFSTDRPIVVFAGQGNNGGDALALARLLLADGCRVITYLFNPNSAPKALSPDCEINRNRLLADYPNSLIEISSEFIKPELTTDSVLVDGLFGSGLTRPLAGGFAAVVQFINQSGCEVVSIDIPSGLMGEDNALADQSAIVRANLTLSLQFPKLSFFFAENKLYVGEWKILNIGLHPVAIENRESEFHFLKQECITSLLQKRSKFGHKGTFGHALIVAGSHGMAGAAMLCTKAALRSGAGLVTLHAPSSLYTIVQTAIPEAIFESDNSANSISELNNTDSYSAIAIGSGIGNQIDTALMLRKFLEENQKPCVLDADALNIIAQLKDMIQLIPKNSILTPHPKEFDRLFGESQNSYQRMIKAQNAAQENRVIIILKGAYTIIAMPNGELFFNSTGNSGMATGGSGDVLTGILGGLLAQGYSPENTAKIGVFLHGRAGDIALENQSEESMIAGDIIDSLGNAFKSAR